MIRARLKRYRRPTHRGASHAMPALIPMIDMLTILVVYLLVHAADYEILPNTQNIRIPQSVSEIRPRETVTVLVSRDAVYVNGAMLAEIGRLPAGDVDVIEPLRAALKREAGKRLVAKRDDRADDEVTVLADKDLPYRFIKRILATCTAAEYAKVSLVVLEREREYRGPGPV